MADNGGGWNAPKLLRSLKAYYTSTTMKVRVSGSDLIPFGIRSGVRQVCALSTILFNCIIDWILGQALQDTQGFRLEPTPIYLTSPMLTAS